MKVTVLVENTSAGELECEHGLSLLIEYHGQTILLDAGSTEMFYRNGCALGIDFDRVDMGVLSHGHYDHSGGFGYLFVKHPGVKVYVHKEAVKKYHSANGGMHEIGIPAEVLAYPERFILTDSVTEIAEGVWLVPHAMAGLEKIGERTRLYREEQGEIVPDDFRHEQSLVFDTQRGLIIFNSCSHGGVETIIHEAKRACGDKRLYAYIGGLHMKGKDGEREICTFSEEELDALCRLIRREQLAVIYTGHCTGLPGMKKLKERLGDTMQSLSTGVQFEI